MEDSSSTWASSIASSLGVFAGSSLPLSGFGAGDTTPAVAAQPGYAYRLVVATDSDRLVWAKGPFSTANIQEGNWESAGASTFNMGDSNFSGTNLTIITREISVGNNLSAHEDCSVQLDPSTITVSSCPVPPPWSFVEVTANDGSNADTAFYFASGASQSKTEIDLRDITWNSTHSYFAIANTGWYEFEMQGSILVGSSPTTVTTSIIQTTGFNGTEVEKINKIQVVRTNIDPHDIMIKWMGYVGAGTNFTCKLDGTGTVRMEKGSTFTCKRIN